ncbi:glycosyltransferase [Flavobacterium gelatinilyticum]|uniref:glycosyltransferase n=1 Tax=Flavobacterium gelatinilyticum TaxID=3003260 RepID=UPI0024816534|nr:glycosyltransferase [Flavobacterium gelatinilyticum]
MINNLKETSFSSTTEIPLSEQAQYYDMIVFSHLRWQHVYQRPQQIISRMAETMKVLVIEEPIRNPENENPGDLIIINEKLHILQPNTFNIESIASIIPSFVKSKNIQTGWFCSAEFCSLLDYFQFDTTVYDCMEELSPSNTSAALLDQEKYLIASADIIFTETKALFQSKKQLHDNVHYFPGSVDEAHFAKALNNISIPADIGDLPSPVVGYYGIIDQRLDFDLLQKTAQKLPEVSFVLIGPSDKKLELPEESNIHYLGMKCYNELPYYLKSFDIAMMPLNNQKNTGPVNVLEYMAARKPIISTKISDAVHDCITCVNVVETADQFADTISFLNQKTDRQSLEIEYRSVLKKTSWDETVQQMKSVIKFFAK